jgi:hypothetical protein
MREQITHYLNSHPFEHLLWLCDDSKNAPTVPASTTLRWEVLTEQLIDSLGNQQFNCAVLEGLPGKLNKSDAESIVAHLRDVLAQRLLWLVEAGSPWTRQDLLALGFRLLDKADNGDELYGYDIDNYKITPDWLNAKHWANPEKWGKKRW